MIKINYKNNLEKKSESFKNIFSVIKQSRRVALGVCGAFLMKDVRKFIETEGKGTWIETHPLTIMKKGESAYFWLGKMARYTIDKNSYRLEIGFGNFSKRDVKKGKSTTLDRNLQKTAYQMQKGYKINVSGKMRRKFGRDRKNKRSIPGVDFFPVKNNTKALKVPPRPVMEPIFKRKRFQVENIFSSRFVENLKEKFEKM